MTEFPWVSVSGFGAHIKSTRKTLVIQKKKSVEEYPIESVRHLLIVGGHTIHSATINQLIRQGSWVSFFESDGTPVGTLQPSGWESHLAVREAQQEIPRQRYAITLAQASIKSRIFAIEKTEELKNTRLFYEGELEILSNSHDEVAYLIKLDEIRRLHRLASDMYYEIMARSLPSEFGFRRRTPGPYPDPVNAMLSFGYSLLYGNCSVAVVGAHLDPDVGFLHEGKGALVKDLIEPLKAGMVDPVVFQIVSGSLKECDFDISSGRCLLSDNLMKKMIQLFYNGINLQKINEQVMNMTTAIQDKAAATVLY
ncbi:MAG: CRISPR-associated endonuclease Cas1 [Methanomicrobiales archaeon]|nr:CRISPR-associated endonuclease Cas1 [Methanomicrobiales archaeon]